MQAAPQPHQDSTLSATVREHATPVFPRAPESLPYLGGAELGNAGCRFFLKAAAKCWKSRLQVSSVARGWMWHHPPPRVGHHAPVTRLCARLGLTVPGKPRRGSAAGNGPVPPQSIAARLKDVFICLIFFFSFGLPLLSFH